MDKQRGEPARLPSDERDEDEHIRLPGLYRYWELEQIIQLDREYRFEDAGAAADGTRLISVYCREERR